MLVSFYQGPVYFSSIALYRNLLLIHSSTAESRCPLTSLIPQSILHSYELCRVFKERTTICFSFRDRLPGRVFDSTRMWDVLCEPLSLLSARDYSCQGVNALPGLQYRFSSFPMQYSVCQITQSLFCCIVRAFRFATLTVSGSLMPLMGRNQ